MSSKDGLAFGGSEGSKSSNWSNPLKRLVAMARRARRLVVSGALDSGSSGGGCVVLFGPAGLALATSPAEIVEIRIG